MERYITLPLEATRYFVFKKDNFENPQELRISNEGKMVIRQNEDYNITLYSLVVYCPFFEYVKYDGKKFTAEPAPFINDSIKAFILPVDFNKKVNTLTIKLNGNALPEFDVEIEHIDADKKAYDDKVAKASMDKLQEAANIKVATSTDLVNVYFQPCFDDYGSAEIELYHSGMMIGKFKVDEGMFFKSITGLAVGEYEFVLIQRDSKNNIVLKSSKIKFSIKAKSGSSGGFVNGKHTVII